MVKNAKNVYFKNIFYRCSNDIGKTWKNIRRIIAGNKRCGISNISHNNFNYTNHEDISNVFSVYFSGISQQIDNSIPPVDESPLRYVNPNIISSLFLNPVSNAECSAIIKSLKNKKTNVNCVSVRAVKSVSDIVSIYFSRIVNKSFGSGIFPNIFKQAIIVPIHKKGVHSDVGNYRPVSLLSFFSKILEKCIAVRLVSFLDNFSILNPDQFGFRRGLSTTDALLDYMEFLYKNIDEKKHVISVFVDFSKAFDTVKHDILLSKLEMYGIRGVANDWFRSYLTGRSQRVRVGSSISEEKLIINGVPQGSVLGSILFLLYVNEISNIFPELKATLFADDTTLSAAQADIGNLVRTIDFGLDRFTAWAFANRLALNAQKTNAILFSNRIQSHEVNFDINIGGVDIELRECTRFLGLVVDNKLKFDSHLSTIATKLSKIVGIIYKLSFCLPQASLIKLYYCLFYPHILYCNLIWGDTYAIHLNTIELLQKKVVRIITGSAFLSHTDPLFCSTKILKVSDVHRYLLGIYMYRNLSSFSTANHPYLTRQANDPLINYPRLSQSRHCISFAGPQLWCNIPINIRTSPSLYLFKTSLKNYFLNQYN